MVISLSICLWLVYEWLFHPVPATETWQKSSGICWGKCSSLVKRDSGEKKSPQMERVWVLDVTVSCWSKAGTGFLRTSLVSVIRPLFSPVLARHLALGGKFHQRLARTAQWSSWWNGYVFNTSGLQVEKADIDWELSGWCYEGKRQSSMWPGVLCHLGTFKGILSSLLLYLFDYHFDFFFSVLWTMAYLVLGLIRSKNPVIILSFDLSFECACSGKGNTGSHWSFSQVYEWFPRHETFPQIWEKS